MCWYGSNKFRKTAKEDILCYKILKRDKKDNNKYLSYHYAFEYKFGELYENPLSFYHMRHVNDNESIIMINDGFHSYNIKSTFKKIRAWSKIVAFCIFHQKIFSDICYKHGYLLSLVECIIPKGSTYYEDEHGLLVSDQIIIKREIDCI